MKHTHFSFYQMSFLICGVLLCFTLHAAENEYTVTNEVKVEKPLTAGVNFGTGPFVPWSPEMRTNAWSSYYSMEPTTFRHNFIATGGGADYIECFRKGVIGKDNRGKDIIQKSGMGYWYVYPDGFWEGAKVRVYRPDWEKYDLKTIRVGKVKKFIANKGSEERLYFETSGPAVQAGDHFVLTMERLDFPDVTYLKASNVLRMANGSTFNPTRKSGVTWKMDAETYCAEAGSTASFKITI